MKQHFNQQPSESVPSEPAWSYRSFLFYTLIKLIGLTEGIREYEGRGSSWIIVLRECCKFLSNEQKKLITPLIILIQSLRKTLTESEMVDRLKVLAAGIFQMLNGEEIKPIPNGGPVDKDGVPKVLAPWKKASRKSTKKGLVAAIWQTVNRFLPQSSNSSEESRRVAQLVSNFPNINKWKDVQDKGTFAAQGRIAKQAAKNGEPKKALKLKKPAPKKAASSPKFTLNP